MVYKPGPPSLEIPRPPSPPPFLAPTSLRNDREERGEFLLNTLAGRVTTHKDKMEPEKSDQDKQWEIPLYVQIDEEENIKSKMKPERTMLQSSPAGLDVEVPR